jgi:hypothetical protein
MCHTEQIHYKSCRHSLRTIRYCRKQYDDYEACLFSVLPDSWDNDICPECEGSEENKEEAMKGAVLREKDEDDDRYAGESDRPYKHTMQPRSRGTEQHDRRYQGHEYAPERPQSRAAARRHRPTERRSGSLVRGEYSHHERNGDQQIRQMRDYRTGRNVEGPNRHSSPPASPDTVFFQPRRDQRRGRTPDYIRDL